jgi:hypothetical protein
MRRDRSIDQLLSIVEQAYNRRSWHGPNLRGSIRGVTLAQAAWRPAASRHNIWELVVHAAYWKYAAGRRLTGTDRGSFPLKGSNWFRRPIEHTAQAWRADVALLEQMHQQLLDAIAGLSPRALHQPRGSETPFSLITGIAAHDLYHAGQIQLLEKLSSAR